MMPLISVVVPVRDHAEALADCLAALARQRHAPASEILVVDNGAPPTCARRKTGRPASRSS